jgi:outer membrane receptor for ferrienterochelin and colicin
MLETSSVQLEDMAVTEPTSEARSKFDDKSATDSLTELVFDPLQKTPNAQTGSDAVKDVSGVAVSKGANGSSNVSVRGIDQRMLRITIDGQRKAGQAIRSTIFRPRSCSRSKSPRRSRPIWMAMQ